MVQPTAACLIIGDEILTGKVHDANSHALAKALFDHGIRLARVETIPDDVEGIAEAVRRLAAKHDHVFTSGGIGPTHDDLTLEAVGRAFDRELAYHAPTLEKMTAFYAARDRDAQRSELSGDRPPTLNRARKKMALFPTGAEVITDESAAAPGLGGRASTAWVPIVKVENVYVLPGVPGLFNTLLARLVPTLAAGTRLHRRRIYTLLPEGEIADTLSAEDAAHPEIAIGSYPHYDADDHKVMVTLEGENAAAVDALAEKIRAAIQGFFRAGETA
jgi:molybdenum cofactor synthesis domain-containing protein